MTDWNYNAETKTLTISGTGEMPDYTVKTWWDSPAPWIYCNVNVEKVIIEEGVTRIGSDAFNDLHDLTSVTIPKSVTDIGIRAFKDTKWLREQLKTSPFVIVNNILIAADRDTCSGDIVIPNGVTSIAAGAFANCDNMTSVTIPDSVTNIGEDAFYWCGKLTEVKLPNGITGIGEGAFLSCEDLTSVTIPDNVVCIDGSVDTGKDICKNAFHYCERLKSVTVPDSVEYICKNAFYITPWMDTQMETHPFVVIGKSVVDSDPEKCAGDIVIPDGIVNILRCAFSECEKLTSVTIPDSVTSIGESAFSWCSKLSSVNIPDSVTSIGDEAFYCCSSLTSVTIPDGVTSIGDEAFYCCSSLTSVTIPDGVTSIGGSAFYDCEKLTSVNIPDSVTSIGDEAFSFCENLETVNIPDGVTSIEEGTFEGCSQLFSVRIPDSVRKIGKSAFSQCENLTSVTMPDNVEYIGGQAFYGTPWLCEKFKESPLAIANGILFAVDDEAEGKITVPDNVTTIGEDAFYDCYYLTSVIIPESVKEINDNAFECCRGLDDITIMGVAGLDHMSFIYDEEVSLAQQIHMIESGDFTNFTKITVKYPLLWRLYEVDPENENLVDYISRYFTKMMRFAIDNNDLKTVVNVCKDGKFLTKRKLDNLIDYAIKNTRNGGSLEIQATLMNYKNEHFGGENKKKSSFKL